METVSIRNLRGASLRQSARTGRPLAITNHRALIAVVIPVAVAWVEHLIETNWSHIRQSVAEGEQAMAAGAPMSPLDDVLDRAATHDADETHGEARDDPQVPTEVAIPLVAALTGQTITQAPRSQIVLERLHAALTVPSPRQKARPAAPAVRTVRIGELTARLIERAGAAGQTLAVTHDRELIGIVIPITPGLVEFLIEQNLSRVLYSIGLAEKQLGTADRLTTLDEFVVQDSVS